MRQLIDNKIISASQLKKCILIDNVEQNLSELIQRRIKALNISKAELARRIGVSRSYIVNMANQTAPTKSGQYEPSPEVVAKLAKVLDVSEIEILKAIGYAPKRNLIESVDDEFAALFYESADWSEENRNEALEMAKIIFKRFKEKERAQKETRK
ncbi:MAG: helix-turn-helix domain-containing protein [Acidobacteria bacterium]|nr:helix-turn-helix domain-containing protein [Acidobacteriota bacterium]